MTNLKIKIVFVIQMLGFASVLLMIAYIVSGAYETKSLLTFLIPMGPVAGSGILAVVVSEISDKRRQKKNEQIQKDV